MEHLTEGTLVELTAGSFKGQFAVVIKQFQEEHFGVNWEMVQVVISHKNAPKVLNVTAGTIEIV